MSKVELKPLSAFEWASVSQYILYISKLADLEEVNLDHIVSFALARLGPDKLFRQKERVLKRLRGNKRKVERFAGEYKDDLGISEISVLRTMYMQARQGEETVEEHLRIIRVYQSVEGDASFFGGEGASDDLEF